MMDWLYYCSNWEKKKNKELFNYIIEEIKKKKE